MRPYSSFASWLILLLLSPACALLDIGADGPGIEPEDTKAKEKRSDSEDEDGQVPDESTSLFQAEIGPDGDDIAHSSGVALVVPPDALEEETEISVRYADESILPVFPSHLEVDSNAVVIEVTPHGLELNKPATLTIPCFAIGDSPVCTHALRLDGPEDDTWEELTDAVRFHDEGADVEVTSFSYFVLAIELAEAMAADAAVAELECEDSQLRCGLETPSSEPYGDGIEVCLQGKWQLAEACECEQKDGSPMCASCGGEGQICCEDDNTECDEGLHCLPRELSDAEQVLSHNNDSFSRRCVASCEGACLDGDTCVTEGDDVAGYSLWCSRQLYETCSAEGEFEAYDEKNVLHLAKEKSWYCGYGAADTSSLPECAIRKVWSDAFQKLIDSAECKPPHGYFCTNGLDGRSRSERYCGAYSACMICSSIEATSSKTTSIPRHSYCYSGTSEDPVCTLDDYEWRCPVVEGVQTTCSTTRRGGCERTAGPFHFEDEYDLFRDVSCN